MSDLGSPRDKPVDDGQEEEYEDALKAADSDRDDSDALSEVDENQFEDYDPETAEIEERPVEIDEDVARTLKASKRQRPAGETKKPKEGRREKKRRDREDDVSMDMGSDADTAAKPRRARRAAADGDRQPRKAKSPSPENEDHLTPEERRKRAIERQLDAAMKKGTSSKRRAKKDEIDLEDAMDDYVADLKTRMDQACQADGTAVENGQPATHKLRLLPEVANLMRRNNAQHTVLDPEINFLQHVKFFLEPLNDGSLPAFNIQRDVFVALTKLPIEKETLLSSKIGRVVLFYTRSKKAEPSIKRMAERLLGEWSRPILKRTDDYKKRHIQTRDFDYDAAKLAQRQKTGSQFSLTQRPAARSDRDIERERFLAQPSSNNRARMVSLPASYTVAPKSTFDVSRSQDHRPVGSGGMEAFRRMTQKGKKKA